MPSRSSSSASSARSVLSRRPSSGVYVRSASTCSTRSPRRGSRRSRISPELLVRRWLGRPRPRPSSMQVGVAEDGGEDVVEVMGDRARDADRASRAVPRVSALRVQASRAHGGQPADDRAPRARTLPTQQLARASSDLRLHASVRSQARLERRTRSASGSRCDRDTESAAVLWVGSPARDAAGSSPRGLRADECRDRDAAVSTASRPSPRDRGPVRLDRAR